MLLLIVAVLLVPSSLRFISAVSIEEHMCGFQQKCSGYKTALSNVDSCCRSCECVDSCKEKDMCCSDMETLNETKDTIKQECLSTYHFPRGFDSQIFVDAPKYFTRSRCPNAFKDVEVKEKCENPTSRLLEDISFVSSVDGKIVYKNRFCGICHGDNGTVEWRKMIHPSRCDTNWENMIVNATSVNDFIIDQCPLYFMPPNNLDLRSVTCFDKANVINQCNHTNKWDAYDEELETQCIHASESLYYFSSSYTTRIYSNLYCYLCNTKSKPDPSTCQDFYAIRVPGESLFTLINHHIWKESESMNKNILNKKKTCMEEEILDTFFNMCRRLYCPALSVAVNGQCVPYMYGDICYILVVNLTPLDRISLSDTIRTDLKTTLFATKKQLGLKKCESLKEYVDINKQSDKMELSWLQITLFLKPSGDCKMIYLWSKIASIQTSQTYIKIMLAGNMRAFRIVWTNLPEQRGEFETLHVRVKQRKCLFLNLQLGSTCPKVRLTRKEYELIVQSHTAADKLLIAPVEGESNDTIYVCCYKYIGEDFATGMKATSSLIHSFMLLTITRLLCMT